MIKADKYYLDNINKIINIGNWDDNPRPVYPDGKLAYTKFITQVFEEYDISNNEFPIPTLRKTAIKTGINEVLWIYQKQSNKLEDAHNLGVKWWDLWDIGDGTIGNRYGYIIKKYGLIDELLVNLIIDPFSRRHNINMYQYTDLKESKGLYPCAYEIIWSVRKDNNDMILDLTLIQRSNDYIVAGYINKIQYVALQMMIAGHCGYKVGKFCHFVQNVHIYDRHFDAVNEILNTKPLDIQPIIKLKENKNFYNYTVNDFEILGTEEIKALNSKLELAI